MAKGSVCAMKMNEKNGVATSTHRGTTCYFCSTNCKTQFDKNPTKYLK